MAKKPPAAPKPGARRTVLQLQGTEAWRAWLGRLSAALRMPASAVADNAIVEYAKARGFSEEAPAR